MSDLEPLSADSIGKNGSMTLYLKLDYKVLLLVFVIFDVFHESLNEIVAWVITSR